MRKSSGVEVSASTEIAATADAVWSTLVDFAQFESWNPFIRHAAGTAKVGETVQLRVRPSLPIPLAFRATVLDCEESHQLRWYGQVLAPWLARAEHSFTIEQIDAQHVRFEQRERFAGLLPRVASWLLAREAKRGFEAMNRALALRACERDAEAPAPAS